MGKETNESEGEKFPLVHTTGLTQTLVHTRLVTVMGSLYYVVV